MQILKVAIWLIKYWNNLKLKKWCDLYIVRFHMVWYSSILTWHSCVPYLMLSIDFHVLLMSSMHVILHVIDMTCQCMRIMWANLLNVSLAITINKSLKMFLNTHVHASINRFNDTSMDNSSITSLSLEPRKWIILLHNNYSLTSYSISCKHITWH